MAQGLVDAPPGQLEFEKGGPVAEILMSAVFVVYSALDALRDKTNIGTNKRREIDGVKIGYLPWPLTDRWHAIKRAQLYLLPVYGLLLWVFPSLLPNPQWWHLVATAVLAAIVWKIPPKPKHWR